MTDLRDSYIDAAHAEIVEDATVLYDPDADPPSAVVVQLERDQWGGFSIDVSLNQIEGSQLAFVLAVARKYELDAREECGWLRLSRHYTDADAEGAPEAEEIEAH